jgi:hypothetical protein
VALGSDSIIQLAPCLRANAQAGSGTHSYSLNIPKELVEEFGWRDRQKLEIIFGGRKHDLTIRDWKK